MTAEFLRTLAVANGLGRRAPHLRYEMWGSCVGDALGLCRPAAPAAHQVDGGAQLEQRVGGGLDAIEAGDGVEDDLLLLGRIVGHDGVEGEGAEVREGARLRPVD